MKTRALDKTKKEKKEGTLKKERKKKKRKKHTNKILKKSKETYKHSKNAHSTKTMKFVRPNQNPYLIFLLVRILDEFEHSNCDRKKK